MCLVLPFLEMRDATEDNGSHAAPASRAEMVCGAAGGM